MEWDSSDCARPDFRNDKGVGRAANQGRSTEERTAERPRGGRGARGRGGKSPAFHHASVHRLITNIYPQALVLPVTALLTTVMLRTSLRTSG